MIGFISDWGYSEHYVGVAKAVIKSIHPEASVIDVTHAIRPFNIKKAAHILHRAAKDFPAKSVFLVVVDPGVGTSRKAIAMKTRNNQYYVGPDNGLFTFVGDAFGIVEIRELENKKLRFSGSNTFHGRDVFAPAAAYLDRGISMEELGSRFMTYEILRFRRPHKKGNLISGEVAYSDRFGNLQTNIPSEMLGSFEDFCAATVSSRGKPHKASLCKTYMEAKHGEIIVHPDSSGFLEIAATKDNAEKILGLGEGDLVEIELE